MVIVIKIVVCKFKRISTNISLKHKITRMLVRTTSCANKDKIKISIPEHYMLDSCGCTHGGQDKIKINILENFMLDSCGCSHGGQMKMNT